MKKFNPNLSEVIKNESKITVTKERFNLLLDNDTHYLEMYNECTIDSRDWTISLYIYNSLVKLNEHQKQIVKHAIFDAIDEMFNEGAGWDIADRYRTEINSIYNQN